MLIFIDTTVYGRCIGLHKVVIVQKGERMTF